MKLQIGTNLLYMDRREWGADATLPRLGYPVPRDRRTHAIMHHTVVIDDDATPNLWESHDEIKAKMRQLQTIRPDLGLDVPYNDVAFLMRGGKLVVCEGRGQDRTGAHTKGHNTEGYALAVEGNFELARDIGPWVAAFSQWWGWLKYDRGMRNLGVVTPDQGVIFGHKDFRDPYDTDTWTACPGTQIMARIEQITLEATMPQPTAEDIQNLLRLINEWAESVRLGVPLDPKTKAALEYVLAIS
jgi:hypothetical protein